MLSPRSSQPQNNTAIQLARSPSDKPDNGLRPVVTEPITNGAQQNGEIPPSQPGDSIKEGKQKAKAIMAASGLPVHADVQGEVHSDRHETPPSKETMPNGTVQTRKRSRSGTRITRPSNPRGPPDGRQKDMYRVQYANRGMVHVRAIICDEFEKKDLMAEKLAAKQHYLNLKQRLQQFPAKTAAEVFGYGYAGYGNGTTSLPNGGSMVVYPMHRRRPGGRKTRELKIPKKELATQSEQLDELVPIRLDIEWDKIRLRDTFTWNLHDRVVTPELFAENLVEDFKLPPDQCGPLVQRVCESIREQIQDFYPQIFIDEEALDPHLPYNAYKNDEMRIVIKLNITIGKYTLVDQIEWEINNPLNVPEEFAAQMTRDLSLSGEFTTAIAHSIREQSQLFTRSLYVTGHPFDGRPVEDQELKSGFLPSPMPSPFRPYQAAKEFTPYLYELNETELEKTELSLSREERRQKRSVNRRGGPALPDLKDRRRTIRTLVVSSVLPGAAETIEDSRIFKRTATVSGKTRRSGIGHKDGLDDSDESESEDSSPGSPAIPPHLLAGTARTRGMRGAATVAQAAMRGNIGRSATPEASAFHHHETRTSGRRFGGKDYRDESVDESQSLIVKLRISRERFKQFLRDQKAKPRPEPVHSTSSNSHISTRRSQSATPAPGTMGPPPSTPNAQQQTTPRSQGSAHREGPASAPSIHPHAAQIGRMDALGPPSPENPIVGPHFLHS